MIPVNHETLSNSYDNKILHTKIDPGGQDEKGIEFGKENQSLS